MCEFSDKLVNIWESFSKKENIVWTNQKKTFFEEKSSENRFFDKIQGEISHFLEKKQLKNITFFASKMHRKKSHAKV